MTARKIAVPSMTAVVSGKPDLAAEVEELVLEVDTLGGLAGGLPGVEMFPTNGITHSDVF